MARGNNVECQWNYLVNLQGCNPLALHNSFLKLRVVVSLHYVAFNASLDADDFGRHYSGRFSEDIKHIILFMRENRSFDHYFGTMAGIRNFGDPDVQVNDGTLVWRETNPGRSQLLVAVTHQLSCQRLERSHAVHGESNQYLGSYARRLHNGRGDGWFIYDTDYSMGYYRLEYVPIHWDIAEGWTVMDNSHQSVLGLADPNRVMWMSGTVNTPGSNTNPDECPEDAGISWQVWRGLDSFEDNMLAYFKQYQDVSEGEALRDNGISSPGLQAFYDAYADGSLPQGDWAEHVIPPVAPTDAPGEWIRDPFNANNGQVPIGPGISDWRRQYMTNMVNAFDFDNPDYSLPQPGEVRDPEPRTDNNWSVNLSLGTLTGPWVGPARCRDGYEQGNYPPVPSGEANAEQNMDKLVEDGSKQDHQDVRQRWVLHAVDGNRFGNTFHLQSASEESYISKNGSLTTEKSAAKAFIFEYQTQGSTHTTLRASGAQSGKYVGLGRSSERDLEYRENADKINWEGHMSQFKT
ncbi:extracellular phospholipase C [Metarhizium acridum CQMa 102]|uniref:Extracellular phospholipase C n=1 Tax=Metarhizium acridum (strain CQMa 102) TaxID=655827 RepID=E9EDX1_METAQ|nr:extracellular phospholipase C [Metarhizium acridum CQMa 102]EFY85863.1 extracellular phospholipase C [Metarhizium acridum CQMa 102]